jgi:hypothetical protein
MRCRILTANDDSTKSGPDDSVGTRRRFSKMTAGLQRHKQFCTASSLTSSADRIHFSVSVSESLVMSFCNQLSIGRDNHSPDHRIGFNRAKA